MGRRLAAAMLLLAPLAAPVAAAPSATVVGGQPLLTDGHHRHPLAPRLVVDERRGPADRRPRPRPLRLGPWTPAGAPGERFALTAAITDPEGLFDGELRLAGAQGEATASLTATLRRRREGHLARLGLLLDLPGPPTVRGRDLQPAPVSDVAYLDRHGAKEIRGGAVTLLADDGVDGVVVRRHGRGTEVEVELFAAAARPFVHDRDCRRRWRTANPRLAPPSRFAHPGDTHHARLSLAFALAQTPTLGRFPGGRRGALVITDHADQSAPAPLTALAWGRSDGERGAGGIAGRGLRITKSLFLHGGAQPQLDDPQVAALAQELAAAGWEIVPHSATPLPDERPVTAAALQAFAALGGRTWIDHQPETNCEAFSNQGFRRRGRYGIADLLDQHGFAYVWTIPDQPPERLDLLAAPLARRAPTLWPLGRLDPGDDGARWGFRTSWAFVDARRFFTLVEPGLDRLIARRGLAILHTYLETVRPARSPFAPRALLVRSPDGVIRTAPRFEGWLDQLAARSQRGELWVPTLAELGDFLRLREQVGVRLLEGGGVELRADVAVPGVTVVAPPGSSFTVEGAAVRGRRRDADGESLWLDLAPKTPVRLRPLLEGPRGASPAPGAAADR